MTLVLIIILTLLFLLWVYNLCTPSSKLWKCGNKIPGPKAYPLIGNSLLFLQAKQKPILEIINNVCAEYGSVARIWLGKQLVFILSDPKDIEVFLSSTKLLNKGDIYRLLDSWLGTKGLITANEDVWRKHRKLLTPSFHFKILENALDVILRNANILCKQLEQKCNDPEFDIMDYIEKCSLDIICETAMGIKLETQYSQNNAYLQSLQKVLSLNVKRALSPWLYPEIIFRFSSITTKYYTHLKILKRFSLMVITDRKQILQNEQNKVSAEQGAIAGQKQVKPFLDLMLTENVFTDEEIDNEVQTFMFAGHDTTMISISFCLYLLSMNKEIQDRLVQEIQNIIGDKNKKTINDFMSMKYLENVIKESLRIYTTVPLIQRIVSEDMMLPSGYLLPAGSIATFNLFFMHNSEKYFDNPNQFNPGRFEHKETIKHPYSYIPFSAGPRNCIGQKFAMLEMKIVLSLLLLRYEILPSSKKTLKIETMIVLRSLEKIPVPIRIKERVFD